MRDEPETLLEMREVLRRLAISKPTFYRLLREGRLTGTKTETGLRFRAEELEAFARQDVPSAGLDNSIRLSYLPMQPHALERIAAALRNPYGLILVAGPPKSGRTTMAYAMLHELNTSTTKIITIENPIEQSLTGAIQIPVQPDIGMTCGSAIQSALRSNPDVLLVSELRDAQSAQFTASAALTGHLVLTNLEATDGLSAVQRLRDLEVEDFVISGAATLIIGQRLLRRVCPHCCQKATLSPTQKEAVSRAESLGVSGEHWREAVGCKACEMTGYRGRILAQELIDVNGALEDAIARGEEDATLRAIARKEGAPTLESEAIRWGPRRARPRCKKPYRLLPRLLQQGPDRKMGIVFEPT